MPSKKIIVDAAGVPSATDATISDIVSTVVSSDTALTGTYGLVQKAMLFVGGMAVQNNRLGRGWNPISTV